MSAGRSRAALKAVLLDPRSTHYAVLGVSPGRCEEPELAAARRVLALELHPDRNDDRRAHDFMARVNVAHATLSDPGARRKYDALLRSTHTECVPCEGAGVRVKTQGFKARGFLVCMGL